MCVWSCECRCVIYFFHFSASSSILAPPPPPPFLIKLTFNYYSCVCFIISYFHLSPPARPRLISEYYKILLNLRWCNNKNEKEKMEWNYCGRVFTRERNMCLGYLHRRAGRYFIIRITSPSCIEQGGGRGSSSLPTAQLVHNSNIGKCFFLVRSDADSIDWRSSCPSCCCCTWTRDPFEQTDKGNHPI